MYIKVYIYISTYLKTYSTITHWKQIVFNQALQGGTHSPRSYMHHILLPEHSYWPVFMASINSNRALIICLLTLAEVTALLNPTVVVCVLLNPLVVNVLLAHSREALGSQGQCFRRFRYQRNNYCNFKSYLNLQVLNVWYICFHI